MPLALQQELLNEAEPHMMWRAGSDHDKTDVEGSVDGPDYCCEKAKAHTESEDSGIVYCPGCEVIYCISHWKKQIPHKGRGQPGHDRMPVEVSRWIREGLEVQLNDRNQAYSHLRDNEAALWFGAGISEGTPVFRDFGRFTNVMASKVNPRNSINSGRLKPAPMLASFVGETGAGKSSLIKLLISMFDAEHEVPVVGSNANELTPTSGDVHLYSDPNTSEMPEPLLYADCEGLWGGNRDPAGAKYRRPRSVIANAPHPPCSESKASRNEHDITQEIKIRWANTPHKQSREFFVKEMYPRILYTFSDVIVFVMKNGRMVDHVIEQLITWARAVGEASSNQPSLPAALIVLNSSKNVNPELWDVQASTDHLLASLKQALKESPRLKEYANAWRERGVAMDTIESLISSYYSRVRVVMIPEKRHQRLFHQQVKRLYDEISDAAKQSLDTKASLRMRLSSEDLQSYLQKAFHHFCTTLETPFDFVKTARANCNIPSDFSGNILKLAIKIQQKWHNRIDAPLIFREMSFMLASCAMVDAVRRGTPGLADAILRTYEEHFSEALQDFCDRHWPCEYVCAEGRCVNVRVGHSKGHQLHNAKVMDPGGVYKSSFSAEGYHSQFLTDIYHYLDALLDKLKTLKNGDRRLSEAEAAVEVHRDAVLTYFYRHLGGAEKFISHSICLSCLVNPPEHCMPCGHILCTQCVRAFGCEKDLLTTEIAACPLHMEYDFSPRRMITLPPRGAGVRILTLDGAGARAIVELLSLQCIEEAVNSIPQHIEERPNCAIPIRAFFDLIVGCGSGGLVALGIGEKGWDVRACLNKLDLLFESAFPKSGWTPFKLLDRYRAAKSHGRYKPQPLEQALATHFGEDDRLFGGNRNEVTPLMYDPTKVAVAATSVNATPYVFANYNRPEAPRERGAEFLRAEDPDNEIRICEVARAAMATPGLFRPFDHIATGRSFEDGGILFNNPIEVAMNEFRLGFAGRDLPRLDLVVSLGAGFEVGKMHKTPITPVFPSRGPIASYKSSRKLARDHTWLSQSSDYVWQEFKNKLPQETESRFHRLDFEFANRLPKYDDISKLADLKSTVSKMLEERPEEIRAIADRLLATAFYFRTTSIKRSNSNGSLQVKGFIESRLPMYSQNLGTLFWSRYVASFNRPGGREEDGPCFVIEEKWREKEGQRIALTPKVIENMRTRGKFAMESVTFKIHKPAARIDIHLRLPGDPQRETNNSISGFPRSWESKGDLQSPMPSTLDFSVKRLSQKSPRLQWSIPVSTGPVDVLESYAKQEFPGLASAVDIDLVAQRLTVPESKDDNVTFTSIDKSSCASSSTNTTRGPFSLDTVLRNVPCAANVEAHYSPLSYVTTPMSPAWPTPPISAGPKTPAPVELPAPVSAPVSFESMIETALHRPSPTSRTATPFLMQSPKSPADNNAWNFM